MSRVNKALSQNGSLHRSGSFTIAMWGRCPKRRGRTRSPALGTGSCCGPRGWEGSGCTAAPPRPLHVAALRALPNILPRIPLLLKRLWKGGRKATFLPHRSGEGRENPPGMGRKLQIPLRGSGRAPAPRSRALGGAARCRDSGADAAPPARGHWMSSNGREPCGPRAGLRAGLRPRLRSGGRRARPLRVLRALWHRRWRGAGTAGLLQHRAAGGRPNTAPLCDAGEGRRGPGAVPCPARDRCSPAWTRPALLCSVLCSAVCLEKSAAFLSLLCVI